MGQFLGGTGKIAVVSSAVASENNNYYVQIRENEFADFIHREYPDMKIVTTLDSFEDPQITYEKTVKLLWDYQDLQGIYITCGGVSQVGRALEESGRAKDIRVISFEDYPRGCRPHPKGCYRLYAGRRAPAAGRDTGTDHHGLSGIRQGTRTAADIHRYSRTGKGKSVNQLQKIFALESKYFFYRVTSTSSFPEIFF